MPGCPLFALRPVRLVASEPSCKFERVARPVHSGQSIEAAFQCPCHSRYGLIVDPTAALDEGDGSPPFVGIDLAEH